jgi:hypothetical protein
MVERKTPGTGSAVSADPRRIAACLAACEGISTEALEDGILLKLVAACVHVKEPRIYEILHSFGAIRLPSSSNPPRKTCD